MSEFVKVWELRPLDGYKLWLKFSNGDEGVRDFADILAVGGQMIVPLRDEGFFKRAFLSMGVPTWPNGLQLDANNLYLELQSAHALTASVAAE